MVTTKVRLVCTSCRRKIAGTRGDSAKRGCEKCGGQLAEVRYNSTPKRKRRRGW